jgi:hypothetical protein
MENLERAIYNLGWLHPAETELLALSAYVVGSVKCYETYKHPWAPDAFCIGLHQQQLF